MSNLTKTEKLSDLVKNVRGEVVDILDEFRKTIPNTLYHYTSLNGLDGILKNREFWVTRYNFLNDVTELYYTYDLCKEIIFEMSQSQKKYEQVLKFLNTHLFEMDENIYILSLTTNMDSNLLWSNYSKNDGYNIALAYPDMVNDFKRGDEEKEYLIYCANVIYDKEKQKKMLKRIVNNVFEIMEKNWVNEEITEDLEDFSSTLSMAIRLLACFFKDEAFSQEEEVRVIFYRNPLFSTEKNFRISNGSFIPYITVPFSEEGRLIKGVTIGPKNKIDIAEKGMELFLRTHGYDYIENNSVIKSRIPYRY
ncbi:DUF2971 domain-containing protein [Bacillus velezensis]|uniref:DUF2971 domain-containing protein n=1 Tax=Bacillus velezensis TaxID=492670 RepID=UPI001C595FE9|nr:DUF2971 domain-containing protein [Bacillus velezensis]MCM3108787.1 DUF2971 domain-containing protein [Bacillus velezensis]MDN4139848.1 DUF2971 domain-containing protein [Bacillus velezensis]MDV2629374.1 DUF2971 domain-containing protein [Bacillus velezensis]MED3448953.1 DUF2971 domain-containing protein [Bacillus velezensis]